MGNTEVRPVSFTGYAEKNFKPNENSLIVDDPDDYEYYDMDDYRMTESEFYSDLNSIERQIDLVRVFVKDFDHNDILLNDYSQEKRDDFNELSQRYRNYAEFVQRIGKNLPHTYFDQQSAHENHTFYYIVNTYFTEIRKFLAYASTKFRPMDYECFSPITLSYLENENES